MCTDITAQVLHVPWMGWHGTRSGMDAPKLSLRVLAPDLEVGKYNGEVLTLLNVSQYGSRCSLTVLPWHSAPVP